MAILPLNVGSGPGAGDGEGLRSSQVKVNSNFAVSENAASKIVQASSADTTADKVMLSDYAWRGAQLGDYFTYGGTANAITLTSANLKAGGTLIAGMKFRFKATTTNTGATTIAVDGGSAIACATPTGVTLPAGFIRTDVITECEYDGSSFVVSRKVESGSNANGEWTKWEDGSLSMRVSGTSNLNITSASALGGFYGDILGIAFPVAVVGTPSISPSGNDSCGDVGAASYTTTTFSLRFRTVSSSSAVPVSKAAIITGKWY